MGADVSRRCVDDLRSRWRLAPLDRGGAVLVVGGKEDAALFCVWWL